MRPALMELAQLITRTVSRTRALPTPIRYSATVAIVLVALGLRLLLAPVLPSSYPFSFFYAAILITATLFDRGSGFVATGVSALLAVYFFLPPSGEFLLSDVGYLAALAIFVAIGLVISFTQEALHKALADLHEALEGQKRAHAETAAALADVARAGRERGLLLREFRHRTRNDLGSLAGLLLLRARASGSDAVRDGLKEAASHALTLARVHTRLTPAETQGPEIGQVDGGEFVQGLCADLDVAQTGDGMRPIALVAEVEHHAIDAERAVPLGLVVNEAVTNALKYAFPDDRPGTVRVRFAREGDSFVLTVADDGIGIDTGEEPCAEPPNGLGTRLLHALAAQLRGSFDRHAGEGGVGTVAELRFPVRAPGASAQD